MAVFVTAAKQLVKDGGKKSLIPVKDLNSNELYKPLCIIEKKESFWFWRSPEYKPTPFTLNDILSQPVDLTSAIKQETFLKNYLVSPTFHASGKVGANLAKELGIDFTVTDSFSLKINLKDVVKSEVKWQDLSDTVRDNFLNHDNKMVDEVLSKTRIKLCVIYESLSLSEDGLISSVKKIEGDANGSGNAASKIGLDGDTEIDRSNHSSFTVPKGTVMAFSCYEISISHDGYIEVLYGDDLVDAAAVELDKDPLRQDDPALRKEFEPLLKWKYFTEFISCLRLMLDAPESVETFKDLLSEAYKNIDKGKFGEFMSIASIQAQFDKEHSEWKEIFIMLGFEEAVNKKRKVLNYTDESQLPLLKCVLGLFVALTGCTTHERLAVKDCTSKYFRPIIHTLKCAIHGDRVNLNDPALEKMFDSNNPGTHFLQIIGCDIVTEGKDTFVDGSWLFPETLEDLYVVSFIMCLS